MNKILMSIAVFVAFLPYVVVVGMWSDGGRFSRSEDRASACWIRPLRDGATLDGWELHNTIVCAGGRSVSIGNISMVVGGDAPSGTGDCP